MKIFGLIAACLVGFMVVPAVCAQQVSAPQGSTGQCKDGTYTSNATKRGACSGHHGVKNWYNLAQAASAPTKDPESIPSAAPSAVAPHAAASASKADAVAPAPGGGPGLVWVNTSSKVYHCQSDKWYGRTKAGSYMSEADAKAKGFHGEHGKDCTQ